MCLGIIIVRVLFGSLLVYIFCLFASTFGDTDYSFYIPISAILGSLDFAAAVGLFFGIWPGIRHGSTT